VYKVVMPQMGESLTEGTVVRWLKAPGDRIERDEPLLEISTDKVDAELPSPVSGVLAEILVTKGQTVAVGVPVAVVAETSAAGGTQAGAGESAAAVPEVQPVEAAPDEPEPHGHFKANHAPRLLTLGDHRATGNPVTHLPPHESFSPAVLDAARRGGLSLATLTEMQGSGRGGRVTKRDVDRYLQCGPPPSVPVSPRHGESEQAPPEYAYRPTPDDRIVPMSIVRRKIADHMAWSVRISPHASAFTDCDMARAAALIQSDRDRFVTDFNAPLTYTVLAAQAVVFALREFPMLNASVVGDNLVMKPHVNLGIAVALSDSDALIVPVIHRSDELSLGGLARAILDVATRAREHRLRPTDVQGGTFTLTNPGMFGGTTGTPILNQPQVGIVGLGAVIKRPVVINDAIAIRPMMTVGLTFDHRAVDGMHAFRFLERVKAHLERPPDDGHAAPAMP
jgi:2-oxoglutarate dehydrogenase E2 component (dihydrolipoamide succinyltransferase)